MLSLPSGLLARLGQRRQPGPAHHAPGRPHPGPAPQTIQDSLKQDVARHPADFVVFQTEIGARRFLQNHPADAALEPHARIAARGVIGYWQGKTIVVLPLTAPQNF